DVDHNTSPNNDITAACKLLIDSEASPTDNKGLMLYDMDRYDPFTKTVTKPWHHGRVRKTKTASGADFADDFAGSTTHLMTNGGGALEFYFVSTLTPGDNFRVLASMKAGELDSG